MHQDPEGGHSEGHKAPHQQGTRALGRPDRKVRPQPQVHQTVREGTQGHQGLNHEKLVM